MILTMFGAQNYVNFLLLLKLLRLFFQIEINTIITGFFYVVI